MRIASWSNWKIAERCKWKTRYLGKLLFTYSNELFSLRSQLLKEEDALKLFQSSSGVLEITKVVQSWFETQNEAGVPDKLETSNLYTADEIAANYLNKALSYDLIDASHPLLKTREGCKAYVKFKESFASSDQCLSLCCNLVSRSAIYFQTIRRGIATDWEALCISIDCSY